MAQEPSSEETEGEWCLVDQHGSRYTLPKTMIFLGREECDIEVQSHTVDKRHAVVTFDTYVSRFKIKDLSTVNGTFVNDHRIPEQEYVALDERDTVRLGYDTMTFYMERFHQPDVHEHHHSPGVTSPHRETPTWGNGERSPMAECTGCIQEQQIQHTCSQQDSELTSAQLDLERSINEDTNSNFSFGCNTWPRKRSKARTKQHITAVFEMDVDQLDNVTSKTTRVLRGTGAGMNNLPPELATVKKGTPLYGQPTWWGDNEPSDLNASLISKEKSKSKMQEIPDKDYSPEKDTTSHCIISSKSTSSVSNVASHKPTNQNGITSEVHSVTLGEATPSRQSHTPEGSASMAFTVQFDETSPKNIAGPLSEFLPDKMKHHFKTRTEKVSEKSSKVTSKEIVHSTQSRSLCHSVSERKGTNSYCRIHTLPAYCALVVHLWTDALYVVHVYGQIKCGIWDKVTSLIEKEGKTWLTFHNHKTPLSTHPHPFSDGSGSHPGFGKSIPLQALTSHNLHGSKTEGQQFLKHGLMLYIPVKDRFLTPLKGLKVDETGVSRFLSRLAW